MTSTSTQGRQMISAFVEHEHEELVGGIDHLHELAEELASLPADRTAASVAKVVRWVDETLKLHIAWEESWLFPQIDDRAHTPWVTRLVRFDHLQIAHQSDRLRADQLQLSHGSSSETVMQVACDLLSLETLLRSNLEREDYFLMPLLECEADRWAPEWRD